MKFYFQVYQPNKKTKQLWMTWKSGLTSINELQKYGKLVRTPSVSALDVKLWLINKLIDEDQYPEKLADKLEHLPEATEEDRIHKVRINGKIVDSFDMIINEDDNSVEVDNICCSSSYLPEDQEAANRIANIVDEFSICLNAYHVELNKKLRALDIIPNYELEIEHDVINGVNDYENAKLVDKDHNIIFGDTRIPVSTVIKLIEQIHNYGQKEAQEKFEEEVTIQLDGDFISSITYYGSKDSFNIVLDTHDQEVEDTISEIKGYFQPTNFLIKDI